MTILIFVSRQEKNGLLTEASHSFKEALDLNPEQTTAKERLENVKQSLSIKRQVGILI